MSDVGCGNPGVLSRERPVAVGEGPPLTQLTWLSLSSTPHRWRLVAQNIPILKFPDGTTKENETYDGVEIKQVDVNLLSYPLDIVIDKAQIEKDLKYYERRMSPNGPAMAQIGRAHV